MSEITGRAAALAKLVSELPDHLTPDPLLSADREREDECEHEVVWGYQTESEPVSLWACQSCKLRFYPACPVCVDVGHRNIVHPLPSPETTPAGVLDEAWEVAEKALPEGWSFWEIMEYSPDPGESRRVSARVRLANTIDHHGNVPEVNVSGPTPAAALHALAATLGRSESGGGRG